MLTHPGFWWSPLLNARYKEDKVFLKVLVSPRSAVQKAKINIKSHTIYDFKRKDNCSFKFKVQIAQHGNDDLDKENIPSDCCMSRGIEIGFIAPTDAARRWRVLLVDARFPLCRQVVLSDPFMSIHQKSQTEGRSFRASQSDQRLGTEM